MARRGRPRSEKGPKRKAVSLQLCPREHAGKVMEPYVIMERLIETERKDLAEVKIGIVWHTKGWRPDADKIKTHGKAVKNHETERQRTGIDWDIQLSQPAWKALDDLGKERLIFHELEHIQICCDKNGEPLFDDKNRIVTRGKRHDIGEHRSVIERYGLPESLSEAALADADRPLLKYAEEKEQAVTEVVFELKNIKGLQKAYAELVLIQCDDDYQYGVRAWLGNYATEKNVMDSDIYHGRPCVIAKAKTDLLNWLDDFPVTGTADDKRAKERRRGIMREAVQAWLDGLIAEVKS